MAARVVLLMRLIHDNDEIARRVVENAEAGLNDAVLAQRKRLYYVDASKRSKAYYPAPALLYLTVFAESERFERFGERRAAIPAETIAIRYVKHLIWIGARRNSFHVALAVCRLLFNYTTSETMAIYDSILQEQDFVKEDYYYRARKRILMHESEERFHNLVRVQRARCEERFAPDPDQGAWLDLVLFTLNLCTPWGTHCIDDPASIAMRGCDAETELARLHVLIHPPCFEALVGGAGLDPPRRRLAMPLFRSENATLPPARSETMAAAGLEASSPPPA